LELPDTLKAKGRGVAQTGGERKKIIRLKSKKEIENFLPGLKSVAKDDCSRNSGKRAEIC